MHEHLALDPHELSLVEQQLQQLARLGALRSWHVCFCHRIVKRRRFDSRGEIDLFDTLAELNILI